MALSLISVKQAMIGIDGASLGQGIPLCAVHSQSH
jgi:hypothetical protein